MNVTHMKYAVEVARTGSITRAAENLYMGQPNLSKAIRELENALGFKVFKRSSAGVAPTARGAEFLSKARDLLARIAEMDSLYGPAGSRSPLRAALPGADYAPAFAGFVRAAGEAAWGCTFAVTDAAEAIAGLGNGEYDLAAIRFEASRAREHTKAIEELGLVSELLWDYDARALTRRDGSLTAENFAEGVELCAGDARTERRLFVRDEAVLLELLYEMPGAYFQSAPWSEAALERYGLVQLAIPNAPKMRDMLLLGQGGSGRAAELAAHIRRVRDALKATL